MKLLNEFIAYSYRSFLVGHVLQKTPYFAHDCPIEEAFSKDEAMSKLLESF